MAVDGLLKPTLHVEVLLKYADVTAQTLQEIRGAVQARLRKDYVALKVGQDIDRMSEIDHEETIIAIEIVDFTGAENSSRIYELQNVQLDVQAYAFRSIEKRRTIKQPGDDESCQTRILTLPNATLHHEWNSLVFDHALPARLLRYLVRMTGMMRQPGLNRSTFNWNRLCLLHGPAGSGKSTLCRALAQKLSIRLGDVFTTSTLVEINSNSMLSKYFGESGKIIGATFDGIVVMAQDRQRLVCVVIDEVETIAGSRDKATRGEECPDGLRATNQLLTALDRIRELSNVIVLCTSNLIDAIDPAFLDRVDMKQLVPSPSNAAIYNIFRSCVNELIRSGLVASTTASTAFGPSTATIPSFSEMNMRLLDQPASPGCRLWAVAQKCEGFSGRALRRLPLQGLAMHTYGGVSLLQDAITALEAAVDQELVAVRTAPVEIAGESI